MRKVCWFCTYFNTFVTAAVHSTHDDPAKCAVDCQVKQGDAEMGEVIVEGIGHRLECPEGIRLSWKLLKSSDHGEEL